MRINPFSILITILLNFSKFSLSRAIKRNAFDSRVQYFRFDPSRAEWASSFPHAAKETYGPVHLWLRCIDDKVRGIFYIESLSDYDERLDDTASYQKKYWDDSPGLNLYLNDQKIKFESSKMPWQSSLSSTSTFYYSFQRSEEEFLTIKVNSWRRFHKVDKSQLCNCKSGAQFKETKNQVFLTVNFADKQNKQAFYQSIKNHLFYHSNNFQIDKYLLVLRDYEVKYIQQDHFLMNAVHSGFVQVFTKPSYFPQVVGHSFRWQAIYENMLILYFWMENIKLLIVDIDEFVVSQKPLLQYFAQDEGCVALNRVHLFCSNCKGSSDKENILAGNNAENWLRVVGDPKFDHPKLLIDPDKIECIYVHWSVCGRPCRALDESSAHILHFINFFEQRSSRLTVSNTSSYPLKSNFVVQFAKNQRRLLPQSTGTGTLFHLCWTTSAEYFNNWRLYILLAIQRAHRAVPHTINIYSNTLTIANILNLPDAYLLNTSVIKFIPIDSDFFHDTPLEKWWLKHTEFHGLLVPAEDDHRYSHLTDLVRLVALWRHGGIYLDFDMLVLRPLTFFANSFASQKDAQDERITDSSDPLNFAIAIFDKNHSFLLELMNAIPIAYNPRCWPCVGPKLITNKVNDWAKKFTVHQPDSLPTEKMPSDSSSIHVFPYTWFYPFYWKRGVNIVNRKASSLYDYRRLINTAVTLHIWSHATNFSSVGKGSVLDLLIAHFRDDKPLVGFNRSRDDQTKLQHLSMSDGSASNIRVRDYRKHQVRTVRTVRTSRSARKLESEQQQPCIEFNALANLAFRAGIPSDSIFQCPASPNAPPSLCTANSQTLEKDVFNVKQQFLGYGMITFFSIVNSDKLDDDLTLNWWLPFLNKECLESGVVANIVFIVESCPAGNASCTRTMSPFIHKLIDMYKAVHFNLVKLNLNNREGSGTMMRALAKALIIKFPHTSYFFRIEWNSLLLPRHLLTFLNTLTAVSRNAVLPISFGFQGTNERTELGWNRLAINATAYGRVTADNFHFVHCGGFLMVRSDSPSEWELRRAITYSNIGVPPESWVPTRGTELKWLYLDFNEWVPEKRIDLKRHCVDFNEIGRLSIQNGHSRDDLYVCPDVRQNMTGMCQEPFQFSVQPTSKLNWHSMKTDDVLLYIAVGAKYLQKDVPALYWWLSLLDKEPPSQRVSSDVVIIADSCKNDLDTRSEYAKLKKGDCNDGALFLFNSLSETFQSIRFHLTRVNYNHRMNLAQKIYFGSKTVYNVFPDRKYYFKFDDDTVVFPLRLSSFLHTLEVGTGGGGMGETPLFFGTVHDKLPFTIDWAQGGSGYGMNNKAMRIFANSEPPTDHFGFGTAEDYFLWKSLALKSIQLIHCGGFFANTVNDPKDWHFSNTLTFHRVKNGDWLQKYGELLILNYNRNPTAKSPGFIDTF